MVNQDVQQLLERMERSRAAQHNLLREAMSKLQQTLQETVSMVQAQQASTSMVVSDLSNQMTDHQIANLASLSRSLHPTPYMLEKHQRRHHKSEDSEANTSSVTCLQMNSLDMI